MARLSRQAAAASPIKPRKLKPAIKSAARASAKTPVAAVPRTGPASGALLQALGQRVRELRARRALTRKAVALAAGVSQRHLANLEYGTGNASIRVLERVAQALHCPLSELIGDTDSASPEWLLTRDLLQRLSEPELRRARIALSQMFGQRGDTNAHSQRVALIGLRGAGKSTLGQMLADDLDCAFIELSREIERIAGCTIREIHDLYGTPAYRRYERQALEAAIRDYDRVVIAAPGGIVSDPESFNQLLAHCLTVWLQAEPEDHMRRVTAQGDLRPMAASDQALDDLRRILNGRTPLYARANLALDTGAQALEPTLHALRAQVRAALGLER